MNQLVDVGVIEASFESARLGEETRRRLVELAKGSDHCLRVSPVGAVDLLFLEYLLEEFDACHALQADAVVVVHFEVDFESEPDALLDSERLFELIATIV